MRRISIPMVTEKASTPPVDPPEGEDWGLRDWVGFTSNVDRAAGTGEGGTLAQWLDFLTTGVLPDPSEYLSLLREGQGSGLPKGGTGAWVKSSWYNNWPDGYDLLMGDAFGSLQNTPGSNQWLTNIKYVVYKIMTESTINTVGILGWNEPERTTVFSPAVLGTSKAVVEANMAIGYRAAYEQLNQVDGGTVPNFVATPRPDILLTGPVFAEPKKATGANASIYTLFANPVFRNSLGAFGSHNHQSNGLSGSNYSYGNNGYGDPPLDGSVSLFHAWNALKTVEPGLILPFIADESAIPHYGWEGNTYSGWETWVNGGTLTQLDFMRKMQQGTLICCILQWAVSLYCGYAMHTGDDHYEWRRPVNGPPWYVYESYNHWKTLIDYRRYDIDLLTDGYVPITAKTWQEINDPKDIIIQIPTRGQPVATYASGNPMFNELAQTTFEDDLITLSPGAFKVLSRPVWLRQIRPHTFSANLNVTGGGKARLVVMGHDKTDGRVRAVSPEVSNSDVNISVDFTPVQHRNQYFIYDPAYAVLKVEHNGVGSVEVSDWRIV